MWSSQQSLKGSTGSTSRAKWVNNPFIARCQPLEPQKSVVSLAPPSHWFDKFSDDDGGAFIGVVFVLYMATFVYTKQERQKVISAAGPALKTTRKIDYFNEKFIYS